MNVYFNDSYTPAISTEKLHTLLNEFFKIEGPKGGDNAEGWKEFRQDKIKVEKFRKTVGWIKANRFKGEELVNHRKDFWKFVKEHDKRRGTNFKESFPELGIIGFR